MGLFDKIKDAARIAKVDKDGRPRAIKFIDPADGSTIGYYGPSPKKGHIDLFPTPNGIMRFGSAKKAIEYASKVPDIGRFAVKTGFEAVVVPLDQCAGCTECREGGDNPPATPLYCPNCQKIGRHLKEGPANE